MNTYCEIIFIYNSKTGKTEDSGYLGEEEGEVKGGSPGRIPG